MGRIERDNPAERLGDFHHLAGIVDDNLGGFGSRLPPPEEAGQQDKQQERAKSRHVFHLVLPYW
jgi:hypothetical protein